MSNNVRVLFPFELGQKLEIDAERINSAAFLSDLASGLEPGVFVAYDHGVFCGFGTDGHELYEAAGARYGTSNLGVFFVPPSCPDNITAKPSFGKA